MALIEFVQAEPAALDGIHVIEYQPGTIVDAPLRIAESLVGRDVARYVRETPPAVAAPDRGEAPAGDADARPKRDAARRELDAYAATLGLSTTSMASKAAVNDAIDEHLNGEA